MRQEPSADRVHCELIIISIVQAAPRSFSWFLARKNGKIFLLMKILVIDQ